MMQSMRTVINDRPRELVVRPDETLLDLLRDRLHLRGTVEGCGVGVCGSCTVLIDDESVSSCLMLATNAEGCAVTTIEGLSAAGTLSLVQEAFIEHQAFQCGFCTPGMIMAVDGLLRANDTPSESEARDYLSGNLCRCGTYSAVLAAVRWIVARRAELLSEDGPRK